ncbi:amino acid permease/ SLC12A domain-containing protein [Mycena haematopus]|nr:amino acid permease/ SLC12A domain-containing protein [Mycena haematopus]
MDDPPFFIVGSSLTSAVALSVIALGGGPSYEHIAFRYWKDPGAFAPFGFPRNTGKFLGWFQTVSQAAYSYLGIESLAMMAAEVQNPRHSLAKAVRRAFYRILMFYVLSIVTVAIQAPSTGGNLLQSSGTDYSC